MSPNFTVKRIYSKEDRKDYMTKFPKASRPNTKVKAAKPWNLNSTSSTSSPTPQPKPNPKERKKLIPKSCGVKISNPKVNAIYHELTDLDVTRHTNAVAVLFR
ncbi:MAG: hypothetical protein ACKO96_18655, partial [Flammeovirgaceae bacterium]